MTRVALILTALLALSACSPSQDSVLPAPVSMTEEALGHYCQMNLSEHPGPKAQVHLDGVEAPLFFSQVRDAIAYQRLPEQSHAIRAIYVNDMAKAPSWEHPGIDNWVAVDQAVYVVGSNITGGMGASELVPFTDRAAAEAFIGLHGGEVLALSQIPDDQILAPVDFKVDADGNFLPPEGSSDR